MIDHSLVQPSAHHCRPPEIWRIEHVDDDWEKPRLIVNHPVGTRYHCDACGQVWVSTWVPDEVGRYVVTCAHYAWQPETSKQRRRRLGLRWWQCRAVPDRAAPPPPRYEPLPDPVVPDGIAPLPRWLVAASGVVADWRLTVGLVLVVLSIVVGAVIL